MIHTLRCASRRPWRPLPARVAGAALIAVAAVLTGCHDLLNPPLPAGTGDPSTFKNEAGALARYRETLNTAAAAFVKYAVESGEFTDELERDAQGRVAGRVNRIDERILPEQRVQIVDFNEQIVSYGELHAVRGDAQEALGALAKYAPAQPPALSAEMYALEGYAELELAEFYCSGVPLSTLDFEGDFTYHAGSPTTEVYEHAIALLDTARTLGADDARIVSLASVGTARALLELGQFPEAAQAAAGVPDGFRYQFLVDWRGAALNGGAREISPLEGMTVADREGRNGLDYVSSADPRSRTHVAVLFNEPVNVPDAYVDVAPFTLASGTEARLIEAEAALQANDAAWLEKLNALRTDGTFDTQPDPTDATRTDTLWHAGTGGVAGLAPLADPGTPDGRVDLLFRERALWLFITGHRQGDLRRLLRQYARQQSDVYPTGLYVGGLGVYGSDITAPIPPAERANPRFTGCFNRNP